MKTLTKMLIVSGISFVGFTISLHYIGTNIDGIQSFATNLYTRAIIGENYNPEKELIMIDDEGIFNSKTGKYEEVK